MWVEYVGGSSVIFLSLASTLLYIRLIFIFVYQRKYRISECYSIMIQMGIAQCFMSPGVITACLTCILGRDYFQMFAIAAPLWMVATRTAGVLGLALALHRLHVICNLSYPTVIHKILTFIAWSYAMGHYFFFVIPCCVFSADPNVKNPMRNFQNQILALSDQVVVFVYEGVIALTFLVYCVLLIYLFYLRRKTGSTSNLATEGKMLIYAIIRFTGDATTSVVLNYVRFSYAPRTALCILMACTVNSLIIPPVMYLVLFKSFRRDVFRLKTKVFVLKQQTQVGPTGPTK